jgi:tetratricopeptide (TPR) repeat protein
MQYKRARKPLPEIARELNVQAVVEGTVLRAGDRVRITLQLIDARNDHHLWAQSYERDLKDVLALQGEIARAVASEVAVELSPETEALLRNTRSVDPAAHDAYLRGTLHLAATTTPDSFKAIEYFEQAIERDPELAEAWAGLADAYQFLGYGLGALPPREASAKGLAAAERALALDDSLAHAHAVRGLFLGIFGRQWAEAGDAMQRALELGPADALVNNFYGVHLTSLGRPRDALRYLDKAIRAAPLSLRLRHDKGFALFLARDYERALEVLLQVLEVDPEFPLSCAVLIEVYHQLGREPEAFHSLMTWLRVTEVLDEPGREEVERVFRESGLLAALPQLLDSLLERAESEYVQPTTIALVSGRLGDPDTTLYWLERAFEADDPSLTSHLPNAAQFDSVRDDPRFQDLLRRMNYPGAF